MSDLLCQTNIPCRPAVFRPSILALLVPVWTALLLGVAIPAQGQVTLVTSTSSFICGEELVVDVEIDGSILDLGSSSFDLRFDPEVLTPVSVTGGSALTGAPCGSTVDWLNEATPGDRVEVDVALSSCTIAGPGSLLQIRFAGVASGTSPLQLVTADLRDGLGDAIATAPVDDVSVDYACSKLSFSGLPASFLCNNELFVDLLVDQGTLPLHGGSLEIAFDPSVIVPVSVSRGSLISTADCTSFFMWTNPNPGESTIKIDFTLLGCGESGSGSLARITFTTPGNADGVSTLSCTSARLRDALNQDYPFESSSGDITVVCPVAVEPATWSTIKADFGQE